ncbi:hypothetical protein WKK05_37595 (plasmid) [Nostoc sp. UHCC 0302]|uniref:hypothetical protein n=1 Tax=Nostoc sp. UHCC 0302 TaxID=3134896 RepID=UPI00311CDCA9
MMDSSDGKEIKKDYLETLEVLLKKIFQKAKEKEYKPDKQILIKVGQENVYKGVPSETIKDINPLISKDLVDKLEKAFTTPEKLNNVVSIRIGKEEVFRVQDGENKVDKLGLSQAQKQTQKKALAEPVYSVEALQKQVDVLQKKMQEQQTLVDQLKTQPQSSESITKLFSQVEEMSKSLEKQQKAIEKTQQSLASLSKHSLPRIQNTRLQNFVGGIENKVKQTSKNLFDKFKDTLTPEIVKLRNSVAQQMSEIKYQISQQVSTLKNEMQSQVDGIKSQVETSVNNVRESVDSKISDVKQKAIEQSVKALLTTFGEKQPDGSITFRSTNFNFEQKGETVNVKANSNGVEVIKDGVIASEVTAEQITQLEKVQPAVDEYLSAQANLGHTEEEYLKAEKEYLTYPTQENLQESNNLSRGMSR